MRPIAHMLGQLDLHRPLHQPLSQIGKQPAGPGDLLLRARTGEQLIDQLITDPPRRHPQSLPHTAAATGTIDDLINQIRRERRGVRDGRAAAGPLRSPYGLPTLPGSGEHQLLNLNVILRSSRHSDLFRSCLHSSYDTPRSAAGRVSFPG